MRNWSKRISEHVTYNEGTKSRTALKYSIENIPNKEELENMKAIAENVLK